jgi:beta-lactamase class C
MTKALGIRLLLCLVLSLPSWTACAQEWLQDYAEYVKAKAQKQNVPGYTFAFVEKGKPATIVSYGKTERSGTAIDQDSVFRLASVSKTFTAMLVAKLVEKNQLDWRTSIATLAPGYGFINEGADRLSLKHLIGQSSGFTPNAYDNLIEANYPIKRVLNMLAKLKPLCAPGQCYTYQNTLFGILGEYFDEQQSSYAQALQQELLSPLGMTTASVGSAALRSSAQWAKPHVAIAKRKWRKVKVSEDYYRYAPAAGVNASTKDMILWLRAMLGEMPQVISPQLIAKVTTAQVVTKRELYRKGWRKYLKSAHYGLGWRVYNFEGHKLNYHGGWVRGYRADIAFAPEQQVGYVMLMNAESNLINELTAEFWHRYFKAHKQGDSSATLASINESE